MTFFSFIEPIFCFGVFVIIQDKRKRNNSFVISVVGRIIHIFVYLVRKFFEKKVLVYQQFEYYMFHKPAGCVTAVTDAMHKTVMDYMKDLARKDLYL